MRDGEGRDKHLWVAKDKTSQGPGPAGLGGEGALNCLNSTYRSTTVTDLVSISR